MSSHQVLDPATEEVLTEVESLDTAQVRLSRPHATAVGANEPGANRL